MSTILESIAELSAKKKAEAKSKLDQRVFELVNGASIDPDTDPQLCQDAGVTLEYLADRVKKRLRLIEALRNASGMSRENDTVDEANRNLSRIKKEQEDAEAKFEAERKHWQNIKNIAVSTYQFCREEGSYAARNCDDPAVVEAREIARGYTDESRSMIPKLDSIGQQIQLEECIATRGTSLNGSIVSPERIERAKTSLAEHKQTQIKLNRRYQLLQLIVPIAHENIIRIACGQEPLPYPIDYVRDGIGNISGIYEGQSSSDEAQQPDAPMNEVTSDKDLEAKKIQMEQASRAVGSMPTRRAKVEPPTVPDLEI